MSSRRDGSGELVRPGDVRTETGFAALDVIRFAAALAVAIYHFTYNGPLRLGNDGAWISAAFRPFQPLTSSLWVAVEVFFVLSGIVIAFSAEGRTAVEFIKRRALRLYPAALICATITVIVWPKANALERYARSILLWPSGPWVSDVYWTLAVEITFYAMVAVALALGGGRYMWRLSVALVLLSSGWWALRIINVLAGDLVRPLIDQVQTVDSFLLLSNGCFFGLGIMLFRRWSRGKSLANTLLSITAGAACLAAIFSAARSADPHQFGLHVVVAPALWLLAIGAMVSTLSQKHSGRHGRWPRVLRSVGLATYPLYLVHAEVGIALMLLLKPIGALPALLITLASVLLLVFLITYAERWLRALISRGMTLNVRTA